MTTMTEGQTKAITHLLIFGKTMDSDLPANEAELAQLESAGIIERMEGMSRTLKDKHGNRTAEEGNDRCECGCKYWENDRCIDCGTKYSDLQ